MPSEPRSKKSEAALKNEDPAMASQTECLAAVLVAMGPPRQPLTPAQREVMKLAETMSEQKIAWRLEISVTAVRKHLQNALTNIRLEQERK